MPTPTQQPADQLLTSLEFDAWRGFMVTHRRLLRDLDRELVQQHGLPLSSYEVLMVLSGASDGRLRMKALAEALQMSPSGLTRIVDDLEHRGFVERMSCPSDARGMEAAITDAGRTAFSAARRSHLAGVRERFAGRLDEEQLGVMVAAWEAVGLTAEGGEDDACGPACGEG